MDGSKGTVSVPATQIVSCGDISCEFLVDPIPRPKPAPIKIRLKPEEQRVTLVDNDKPNSLQILERTQAILRQRGIAVHDKVLQKGMSAGLPMPANWLQKYANDKGLLVFGIND